MRARIVPLSISLALGSALMAPAAVAVAEPAASPILPVAECKITSPVASFNEGFARDAEAAAATGTLTVQVIYAEFPDHAGGGPDDASLEMIRTNVAHGAENLETQSGGRLDVVVSELPDRVMLPHAISHYAETEHVAWSAEEMSLFVGDAIAAADPMVDFSDVDVVWVFSPWAYPLPWYAQATNSLSITADGGVVARAVTMPTTSDIGLAPLIVHETGHTFGLPDLYDTSNGSAASYLGAWDPMSGGGESEAVEFMGWHLWRLGWIEDEHVTCLSPSARGDVVLDALTRRGDSVIAVIPTAPTRAVVVESRRAERYDAGITRPGVLVYVVFTETRSGEGPVLIGARDGTEFPTDADGFAAATLTVGERYSDWASGFTVTVIASGDESDTIRIGSADAPTEPPIDPGPDPAPPVDSPTTPAGAVATLPPTGSAPANGVVVAILLLLTGAAAFGVARTRTTSPARRTAHR